MVLIVGVHLGQDCLGRESLVHRKVRRLPPAPWPALASSRTVILLASESPKKETMMSSKRSFQSTGCRNLVGSLSTMVAWRRRRRMLQNFFQTLTNFNVLFWQFQFQRADIAYEKITLN